MNMTYAGTGVNYDAMDPHKRKSLEAGTRTKLLGVFLYIKTAPDFASLALSGNITT